MQPRKLTQTELIAFSKNVETRLAAHEISALDNALADDLAAMLAPLNTAFTTSFAQKTQSKTAYAEQVQMCQNQENEIIFVLQQVMYHLKAAAAPSDNYAALGFDVPVDVSQTVIALMPLDLAAFGTSNGVNTLKWASQNKPGSVAFDIEMMIGDTAPWALLASTRKQRYQHVGVIPGQYYAYRVRARSAANVSEPSNVAVVYGLP